MMWDWNDSWSHGYGGGGWLMFFGMILVTVAVVLLVVYLVRLTAGAGGAQATAPPQVALQAATPMAAQSQADSARELLRRRYAAGEIERDEYLQKLEDLSS